MTSRQTAKPIIFLLSMSIEDLILNRFISDTVFVAYRLRTPPSNDALRHSGPPSRLCTSLIVTLYFDVELSNANRPGTKERMKVIFF